MDLEDIKINVKVKLALFWVALMFFYLYNDLFSFFQPGHVAELVEGHLEGIVFTQELLFGAALLMALPSIMIFLSLTTICSVGSRPISFRWMHAASEQRRVTEV